MDVNAPAWGQKVKIPSLSIMVNHGEPGRMINKEKIIYISHGQSNLYQGGKQERLNNSVWGVAYHSRLSLKNVVYMPT